MAAFCAASGMRVRSSMAAAPARNASILKPSNAIGRSPTALITEVRPPIQSCIGKRASHWFCSARFRDHNHERLRNAIVRHGESVLWRIDLIENAIKAVRVSVIEKIDVHWIVHRSKGVGY